MVGSEGQGKLTSVEICLGTVTGSGEGLQPQTPTACQPPGLSASWPLYSIPEAIFPDWSVWGHLGDGINYQGPHPTPAWASLTPSPDASPPSQPKLTLCPAPSTPPPLSLLLCSHNVVNCSSS